MMMVKLYSDDSAFNELLRKEVCPFPKLNIWLLRNENGFYSIPRVEVS